MTDELTPAQDAAVRRLLGQARHDEPIPADVAARLDEALAELSSTQPGAGVSANAHVHDFAAARVRRRNAGRLLMAAAAVLVGGVALGQAIGGGSADQTAAESADSAIEPPRAGAEEDGASADLAAPESQTDPGESLGDAGGAAGAEQSVPTDGSAFANLALPVFLTEAEFAETVTAVVAMPEVQAEARGLKDRDLASNDTCAEADYGPGLLLPATYDGEVAVLAIRMPVEGSRLVEVLSCGTAFVLDAVSVPVS